MAGCGVAAAGADFALTVDDLSALVIPVVAIVALLVVIFAAADITTTPARFHGLMLLFVASVMVTTSVHALAHRPSYPLPGE